MSRDYSKFLNEDGRLSVKLLPRRVYTVIVTRHRQRDEVINDVFERLFFLWDLNQIIESERQAGNDITRAEAAQRVLDSMDDGDWWRVMRAFEERLIGDFREVAQEHADLLDPVYDEQETQGWIDLQP